MKHIGTVINPQDEEEMENTIKVKFITMDKLNESQIYTDVGEGYLNTSNGYYLPKDEFSKLAGIQIAIDLTTDIQGDLVKTGDVFVPMNLLALEKEDLLKILDFNKSKVEKQVEEKIDNPVIIGDKVSIPDNEIKLNQEPTEIIRSHTNTRLLKSGVIVFPLYLLNLLNMNPSITVAENISLTKAVADKLHQKEISSLSYNDIVMVSQYYLDYVEKPEFENPGTKVASVIDVVKMVIGNMTKYKIEDRSSTANDPDQKEFFRLITDRTLLINIVNSFKQSNITIIEE